MSFLYRLTPIASEIVAWTGAFTAFFAATIALAQNDIKKVLAFSTVSQLGFMVLAMGVGAYAAGIFHLATHAYFKALLFLAAGSVIHAMHGEQNIEKMGGLKNYLVGTTLLFAIATLAIVGFPGLSGWFSKDEILHGAVEAHQLPIFWLAVVAALLTVAYMVRLFTLVFLGTSRASKDVLHRIHESPTVMLWPMWVLAIFSVVGGKLFFHHALHETLPSHHPVGKTAFSEGQVAWGMTLAVLVMMFLAFKLHTSWRYRKPEFMKSLHRVSSLLRRQYRFDDLTTLIAGSGSLLVALFARLFDTKVIDRRLDRLAEQLRDAGGAIARLQTGYIRTYALMMVAGCVMVGLYLFWGGR
jgi:NADH-quinone oxidoreductase subunit L